MPNKGERVWTEDKEEVRTALYHEHQTPEQIYAKGKHGWAIINDVINMVEKGEAPPSPWEENPENPLGDGNAGLPEEKPKLKPKKPPKAKTPVLATADFHEATLLNVVPKAFTTTSFSIWLAMEAAQRCWGWPKDMTPGQFLDLFLPKAFQDYGIMLLSFVVLPGADLPKNVGQVVKGAEEGIYFTEE